MEKMYKLLYESRKRTVEYLRDIYQESYVKHIKIYRAIKEKDIKKARRAMIQHFFFVEKQLKGGS